MLYTTFTVKDRDYKARLTAQACVDLEKKLGTNPLNVFVRMMGDGENFNLPSLGEMIAIIHASLQAYEHGISIDKTYEIYDAFIEDGHNQMDLFPILIEIFKVSGLIPEEVETEKNA